MILYYWKKRITITTSVILMYELALQVVRITCCMCFAETAGSVGITLLEKGVMPRVPKSRAWNKSRIRKR
jgi:hypothetical protein